MAKSWAAKLTHVLPVLMIKFACDKAAYQSQMKQQSVEPYLHTLLVEHILVHAVPLLLWAVLLAVLLWWLAFICGSTLVAEPPTWRLVVAFPAPMFACKVATACVATAWWDRGRTAALNLAQPQMPARVDPWLWLGGFVRRRAEPPSPLAVSRALLCC